MIKPYPTLRSMVVGLDSMELRIIRYWNNIKSWGLYRPLETGRL